MPYFNWNEWKSQRESLPQQQESKVQRPDYSFDSWLKMTKELGDDMSSFVTKAKEKDSELEAEAKKKKQEPASSHQDDEPDEKEDKKKEDAWKRLRDIAKERQQKPKSSTKSSSSSEK